MVLTVLFENLNPLLSNWLSGNAPWIPLFFVQRQLEVRYRAFDDLSTLSARLDRWNEQVRVWRARMGAAISPISSTTDKSDSQFDATCRWARTYVPILRAETEVKDTEPHVNELIRAAGSSLSKAQLMTAKFEIDQVLDSIRKRLELMLSEQQGDFVAQFPAREVAKPTRFGNLIAAIDTYALSRYGMSASLLWPRLRQSQAGKEDTQWAAVDDAKTALDFLVACVWVHIAVVIIGLAAVPTLWRANLPLLAILVFGGAGFAWMSYGAALQAVTRFSVALAASVDLNRWALLDALHLPKPSDAKEEFLLWSRMGMFLSAEPPPDAVRGQIRYRW